MSVERINPPELGRPSGFSHAVVDRRGPAGVPRRADRAGRLGPDRRRRRRRAVRARARQPADRAVGGGRPPEDLVSVTIYIVDMDDYRAHAREIGRVWRRLAGTEYPAMAGIGVSRLWDAEALVEVQGVAVHRR